MALDSVYLFQECSEHSRDQIASIMTEESYPARSFLLHVGDPADYLYILRKGWVRLSVWSSGLLSHIVSDPGEAIGWSSVAGTGVYTASAECVMPVTVFQIGKEDLNRILNGDPASGFASFRRLSGVIAHRLVASYGATLSMHATGDAKSFG